MIGDVPPADICGRLPDEPREVYDATTCLGHSKLSTFLKNPRLFQATHVLRAIQPRAGEALDLGIAFHALALEGEEAYRKEVIVGGPVNPKTQRTYGRDTKAFADWLETQPKGRVYLDNAQDEMVRAMVSALGENKLAAELLFNCPHREVTYRPAGGLYGLGIQCRVDMESDEPLIVDLKSCESIEKFERNFQEHGYHRQAAAYRRMRSMVTGEPEGDIKFMFIAVAKEYPFEVGVFDVEESLLDRGMTEFTEAVYGVRHALTTGEWPRDHGEVVTIKEKRWAR